MFLSFTMGEKIMRGLNKLKKCLSELLGKETNIHEYFSQKEVRTLEELKSDLTQNQIKDIIYNMTDARILTLMYDGKIFFRYEGRAENKDLVGWIRHDKKNLESMPMMLVLASDVDPYSKLIVGDVSTIDRADELKEYL